VWVCVCVCVWERERERESVRVCACVCDARIISILLHRHARTHEHTHTYACVCVCVGGCMCVCVCVCVCVNGYSSVTKMWFPQQSIGVGVWKCMYMCFITIYVSETSYFKEPTNRSHPIYVYVYGCVRCFAINVRVFGRWVHVREHQL